jgi:hypothetical protein
MPNPAANIEDGLVGQIVFIFFGTFLIDISLESSRMPTARLSAHKTFPLIILAQPDTSADARSGVVLVYRSAGRRGDGPLHVFSRSL